MAVVRKFLSVHNSLAIIYEPQELGKCKLVRIYAINSPTNQI